MKALTICQPYAELIARGAKLIENRTWATPYRGQLAIHAGKSRAWMDADDERLYPDMAFGAIVAVATLTDCIYLRDLPGRFLDDPRYADHAGGPWCWILENVWRTEPVTVRGAQGLWTLDNGTALALMPAREVAPRERRRETA